MSIRKQDWEVKSNGNSEKTIPPPTVGRGLLNGNGILFSGFNIGGRGGAAFELIGDYGLAFGFKAGFLGGVAFASHLMVFEKMPELP